MFLTSSRLPVLHAFSTREGGLSEGPFASLNLGRMVGDDPARVSENSRRFAARLGLSAGRLIGLNQVHGEAILEVPGPVADADEVPAPLGDADGLVTDLRGVALGIRTADCVPVLIYAPDVKAIAAVHAGWRGAVLAIAAKAVARLRERYGASPSRILAAVGPSIRRCCYEVGEEVAGQFERRFGAGLVERTGQGGPRLDIAEASRRALVEAGVPSENVDVLPHCTCCAPEHFFSHRRDRGRSGRHLSIIALP